ncbi:hypothetical protein Lepto7376_1050 [[Leptolyngbya] sp. PCC 7376]|uniref:hypothetical protein n=1 Tax=[Leptolyngbya] sp. PCC 7376 TaxID=111781 RepID=UPI00029F311F|nr:hypothetical protein [[Leptolyngbya] sp. PCC 7376]AFY37421.1 hypothetical protein Lepto7376_1050 [[Leptolyngbya] sp. PCC 7376]
MLGKFPRTILFASLFVFSATAVWQRDVRNGAIAALLTGCGMAGGSILVERERKQAEQREKDEIQDSLKVLRQEQTHLDLYVNEAFELEQELSASVRSLKSERLRLLNRINTLNDQRNEITAEVKQLQEENLAQTQLQETTQASLSELQIQYQQLQDKLDSHAALDALAPEIRLTRVQQRLAHVRRKLAEHQHQQKLLQTECAIAQEQKIDLEGALYDLKAEFNVLEQRYTEMQDNLDFTTAKYREMSFNLLGSQAAIKRLTRDILHKRQEKAVLLTELKSLQAIPPSPIEEQTLDLLPTAWQAWFRFVQNLAPEEQAFLKIILYRQNLVAVPTEFPSMSHAPIETLATVLQERAESFLGESPFERVADRPLLQLKAEYHSLLSQSVLVPITEDTFETKS